ncbi:PTS system mannitol-specific IIB component [Erysipelotrichaceae bacterium]|nr:PTS system mannitol-specific IIB component [Erysipelotrichaceae bacterium]
MLKILAACGNGMGSSMVIKMKIENALKILEIEEYRVDFCSVGEAKSVANGYDIVVASQHLINELEGRTTGKLVGLANLMDDVEIREKLEANISKG